MKHTYNLLSFIILIFLFVSCQKPTKELSFSTKTPYELVNPFIGTGGHGHTFPGATLPFGMVQLSPDTRLEGWDGCSGYHYTDSIVYGFSHTHLSGTGVPDYGDVLLMPTQGAVEFDNGYKSGLEEGYASPFKKDSEHASPGLYSVHLDEHNIDVRLTATERTGIHEYTFKNAGTANIILDLDHRDQLLDWSINQINETTIEGSRISKAWAEEQHVYFVIESSKAFDTSETQETKADKASKMALSFTNKENEKVILKVGISAVSIDGARANLEKEATHWDVDQYITDAKNRWTEALSKIQVQSEDEDKLSIFYTALYHCMIAPNLFSDVTGEYRGMDMNIHQTTSSPVYTVFSLWDVFRAGFPLYTIIEQEKTNAFINTFLLQYEQGGRLPVWELAGNETECMIGYHSVSVIADAYAKGIRGYDANKALTAMQHSAELDHFGLAAYKDKGFIAAGDEGESVSKTLEYAYDDWCIAAMAEMMNETNIYEQYIQRAQYYKNIFNPKIGFMQAKMNSGWTYGFDPTEVNFNFTEANSWQYSMFAPQDISGMIELYGGAEAFEQKLDELFTTEANLSGRDQHDITGLIGQYAHGNEPSHHMAYLYNYIGKAWKTQERIEQILREQYQNAPDGLSGNEDCGQMSAWYVLSAMGFYSVTPGLDYYTIGTPHFAEMTVQLENGKTFAIKANGLSEKNLYIQSVTLNGKPYNKSYIQHDDIVSGGILEFEMGEQANTNWGKDEGNYPVANIPAQKSITPVPYFSTSNQVFTDSLLVEISSPCNDCEIYYKTNDGDFRKYESKFYILETTKIDAYSIKNDNKSFEAHSLYSKIKGGRSIDLKTTYSNQYTAGGDNALIDFLSGSNNYRTGHWQGYEGVDLLAVVNLGQVEDINRVSLGALQDIKSWIWYPQWVKISVSSDNEQFEEIAHIKNDFSDHEFGAFIKQFTAELSTPIQAQYVKVEAKNYGVCPDWHLGAGGKTWIFADEISVE